MSEQIKLALSVEEAAKAAGVGRTLLFEEIRDRRLIARKVGRRTIITIDDLRDWLCSRPTAGEGVRVNLRGGHDR
jgi:excisionase family DNA binding protein